MDILRIANLRIVNKQAILRLAILRVPSQSLPKSVTFLPPDLGPVCMTLIPAVNTHTNIKVTAKKCDHVAPRFGTCMKDPYTSTHTTITITAKKCDFFAPDLGPKCMTLIPVLTPSQDCPALYYSLL